MTDYIAKAEFKLTAKVEREKLKEIIILLDLQKEELSKQKVIIDYRSGQHIKTKQQILPLGPKYEVIDSQGIKLSLKDIHAFYSVCKADDFEKERNLGCIIFRTDNVNFFTLRSFFYFLYFCGKIKEMAHNANLIKERTPSLWIIISNFYLELQTLI